jgi:diguanylate cyclase (GGDEF)-like protein/PAS domain S-box-containing protein
LLILAIIRPPGDFTFLSLANSFGNSHWDDLMVNAAFYHMLLDYLYDGVYFVDRDGRITYWNKAAETITGYRSVEVVGKHCSDNLLMHVDGQEHNLCLTSCPLKKSIVDGVSRTADVYLHHKEGFRLPVAVRVTPIRDGHGRIVGGVELFSDNSAKVSDLQKMKELEGLVYTDQLTGVANRKYIEILIQSRLEEMQRYSWPFGVLFLDIDHFKYINDTYGHDIGDHVLRMVSQTLLKNIRSFDSIGRWGGEEFIGVIANVNKVQLSIIAEKIRKLIQQSRLILNGTAISVTISIGAILVRPDDLLEGIVKRADKLMYQSKANGRNCVTLDDELC